MAASRARSSRRARSGPPPDDRGVQSGSIQLTPVQRALLGKRMEGVDEKVTAQVGGPKDRLDLLRAKPKPYASDPRAFARSALRRFTDATESVGGRTAPGTTLGAPVREPPPARRRGMAGYE